MDNFDIPEEEAIQYLTNLWLDDNAFECEDWDTHIEAERLLERQREEQKRAEAKELQRRKEEEHKQTKQDERKKNRNKFLPFADIPMSANAPVTPSLALRKLRKGEFCELYFFTNKGLEDVQATSYWTDDEELMLTQDEHGLHSFIPLASAKAKQRVVNDKDLTWQQIDEATHRMLQAMRECGWEEPLVRAHIEFWVALGSHNCRHHHDEWCK